MTTFETKELSPEIIKEVRELKKNKTVVNVMVRMATLNKDLRTQLCRRHPCPLQG